MRVLSRVIRRRTSCRRDCIRIHFPGFSGRQRGITLVEMVITSAVSVIILLAVMDIFSFALRQWGVRVSEGTSIQQANLAMERIESDLRSATSFSVQYTAGGAKNGNPIFTLVLPKATDSAGNYIPKRSSTGALTFVAGPQLGFYLSDKSGKVSLRGGTVLWRATRAAGQTSLNSWKPDTGWSLDESGQPRFAGIEQFSITQSGASSPLVQATLVLSAKEGAVNSLTTVTRQVYLTNNDASLGSG